MDNAKKRVYMLDILRGIAVLGMVFHHSLVSAEIVFDVRFEILDTTFFSAVQLLFVAVFLIVSGICTNYSRNVMRRGLIVFSAALIVSFATCIVLPALGIYGLNIYFGILHMFGLSMIIYAAFQKYFEKLAPIIGILIFSALFIVYYAYYISGPTSDLVIFLPFGILPNSITSYGDYYPLFPYFFLFLVGTYFGKYVVSGKLPDKFYEIRLKPVEFIGRYSLWVYILHQPIIFGSFMAIQAIINR